MLQQIKLFIFGLIYQLSQILGLYQPPVQNPEVAPSAVSLSMVNQSVNHAVDTLVPNLLLAYFVTKKKDSLQLLDGWLKLGNAPVNIENLTSTYPKLSLTLKTELTDAIQQIVRKNVVSKLNA